MTSLSFPAPGVPLCPVVLHDCGKKVRLGADGWGYCRQCRQEFDGQHAWKVPGDLEETVASLRGESDDER